MLSDAAIRTENLGKQYRLGEFDPRKTFRESLRHWVAAPVRRVFSPGKAASARRPRPSGSKNETIWALRDVSLEVARGEVLGIIGRNGAGKTTLLKILAKITRPTTGRAELCGRLGSLLEVGTGFHPELTGRENVFFNGAILGMTRAEIRRKFDEIVAFSGVEKFLDTPIKRYSSGMSVRLAFSVAAHLEPEILVVDEVLAVGDAEFQKRCLGKMEHVARGGRTVLFVSHNMAAQQELCSRVIWLEDGSIRTDGPAQGVVMEYLSTVSKNQELRVWEDVEEAPGSDVARLCRACVRLQDGVAGDAITIRTPFVLEFDVLNLKADAHLHLSVVLMNSRREIVFAALSCSEPGWEDRRFPGGLCRYTCHVPGDLLNEGLHHVRLVVAKDKEKSADFPDILCFEVFDDPQTRGGWSGIWPGAVRPRLHWTAEFLSRSTPPLS